MPCKKVPKDNLYSFSRIGPSNRLLSIVAKDGAESVLLHKSSNKSSNILLHKLLSAPSFGRLLKTTDLESLFYYIMSYWWSSIKSLILATDWLKVNVILIVFNTSHSTSRSFSLGVSNVPNASFLSNWGWEERSYSFTGNFILFVNDKRTVIKKKFDQILNKLIDGADDNYF